MFAGLLPYVVTSWQGQFIQEHQLFGDAVPPPSPPPPNYKLYENVLYHHTLLGMDVRKDPLISKFCRLLSR